MPRRRPTQLALQALEARDNPATFGETWYDPTHLTLSFAPDGTQIVGTGSSLNTLLVSLGQPAKVHILKAFQTWAARTNLNLGLVGDSGDAFGAVGGLQHDPRFGDIRLGGRPLASDVLAITAPNGLWSDLSGEVVLNTKTAYSLTGAAPGSRDLFTVMLQESGHTFGLSNSPDTASVMYEYYSGARFDLSAGDVANIQGMYGARQADAYEGAPGNDTQATATPITGPVTADLTTKADSDWYQFVNPTGAPTTVRLRAKGLSLLTAKVEVYDGAGTRLATAATADPLNNDLTVSVPATLPGAALYVKVSGGRDDVFGVGAYQLTADALGAFPTAPDPYALADAEVGANDTAPTAVALAPVPAAAGQPVTYATRSALASAADADYFRVTAPAATGPAYLVVSVSGVGVAGLSPAVTVFAADGTPVAATVTSSSDNHLVLAVANPAAGADYLVRVASATGAVANYDLAAAFRADLPVAHGTRGTLADQAASASATMNVYQSQVLSFTLEAAGADTTAWVTVYNSANQVVFRMAVGGGQSDTGLVFLQRGSYRVEVQVTAEEPGGSYGLQMVGLTDPEGAPLPIVGGDAGGGDILPPAPTDGSTITILPGVGGTWF